MGVMRLIKLKYIIIITIIIAVIFFIIHLSSAIGWYGYDKWKYRKSTFGDKIESIQRKVFIKDLEYSSSIDLDSFNIYIEKGFRYGYNSSKDTRLSKKDIFPYQICYNIKMDTSNIYGFDDDFKINKFDSIPSIYFLREPKLEKPFIIKINKLQNKKWDSIGYIKVWDKVKR
jgi:hypothetical protein